MVIPSLKGNIGNNFFQLKYTLALECYFENWGAKVKASFRCTICKRPVKFPFY